MKLRVLSDYANRDIRYPAGAAIEVEDQLGAFLLRDAPGSFVLELGDDDTQPVTLVNPGDLSVQDALTYAQSLAPGDLERFLTMERAGKNRATLLKAFEQAPADRMLRGGVTK